MTLREKATSWIAGAGATFKRFTSRRARATGLSSKSPMKAGGRISIDNREDVFANALAIITPFSSDDTWRNLALDSKTLDRISPTKIMELLADISPEVSRAVWDFLRMCNPGYEVKAFKPGSETVDKVAQAAVDAYIAQLKQLYGSPDVLINRLYIAAYLRGGFIAEAILDEAGRMPIDLATPDPASLSFRRVQDPVRGRIWQIGQWQLGGFVPLDRPTVRYIPVDPFPGQPQGRAPAHPALFTALFTLGLLHDLRRVVAQQGYPRLDLEVDLEKLKGSIPPEAGDNPVEFEKWVNSIIEQVQQMYGKLEPDDAYVHTSVVKVNNPKGAVDAKSLGAVDGLIEMLERQACRALKTFPLMMSLSDRVSEGQASRQWEIYAAGIKSLQHLCESLLEYLFTIVLQAQGIVATVEWRFAELRVAELLRDAQVQQINLTNARMAYDNGYVSQDEAAHIALGRAKADQPKPRAVPAKAGGGMLVGGTPDPGATRQTEGELEFEVEGWRA